MSPEARADRDRRNHALRIAFVITLGIGTEWLRGSALPFLGPLIAVQLLARPGPPPGLKLLIVMLGVMGGAGLVAWMVSTLTASNMLLYALGVGVLYLWSFTLCFTPKTAMLGPLFVTMTVMATTLTAASSAASYWMLGELLGGVTMGFVLVYLAHVVLPHRGAAAGPAAQADGDATHLPPVYRAAVATVIMLPMHLYLTADGVAAMVVLMTIATMVRQADLDRLTKYGLTFACGNALGGVLAAVAAGILLLHTTLPVLLSLTAAASLILATTFVRSPAMGYAMLPALVCFCVLFGLAISPLTSGEDVAYVQRVAQILMAVLYTLAVVSLIVPWVTPRLRRLSPSA